MMSWKPAWHNELGRTTTTTTLSRILAVSQTPSALTTLVDRMSAQPPPPPPPPAPLRAEISLALCYDQIRGEWHLRPYEDGVAYLVAGDPRMRVYLRNLGDEYSKFYLLFPLADLYRVQL